MRIVKKIDIIKNLYETGVTYPAPTILTYLWNFGVMGLIILIIQIITGLLLVMFYCPNTEMAFASVEHIMRDINLGWLLRYVHANGASFFFLSIYIHFGRGVYYGSFQYPRQFLWLSGVVILLIMIITAFLGYILPWGQMSLWGATVITNLVTVIPVIGINIAEWLWGGFSVGNPTLNKFFSLHFFMPFVILLLVILHFFLLHLNGSNNPLGIGFNVDKLAFTPYYLVKDMYFVFIFLIIVAPFIFFAPDYLGHPDNYIMADSFTTPEHIVPEWYFLSFYAILRSIPDKLIGVVAMLCSILIIISLSFVGISYPIVSWFSFFFLEIVVIFLIDLIKLTMLGGKPAIDPYLSIGLIVSGLYFGFYVLVLFISLSKYILSRKIINWFVLGYNWNMNSNIKSNYIIIISVLSYLLLLLLLTFSNTFVFLYTYLNGFSEY